MLDGPLIDFSDADVRCEVELEHATLLGTHGMDHLGLSQITADTRPVTQTIAADLHDRLGAAGIRFPTAGRQRLCRRVRGSRRPRGQGELLVHSPQGVTLTEAGSVLLVRVGPAVQAIDAGVEQAQHAAAGRSGVLRVGFLSSLAAPAVPRIAAAFRGQVPGVELDLSKRSMIGQLDDLPSRRIDVELFSVTEYVDVDDRDLHVDLLVSGPHYAVLPAPRARARSDMAEIGRESFVMRREDWRLYVVRASRGRRRAARRQRRRARPMACVAIGSGLTHIER